MQLEMNSFYKAKGEPIRMYDNLSRREKGKITEFQVISRLIMMGLDLYVPIIDVGIDCILRIEKHGKPTRYYEVQIKSTKYNISIRGAKKIVHYIKEKKPKNYFLIIAIRKNGEIKHIYLTAKQIIKYAYPSPEAKDIDVNVPARDRDKLIKSQTPESLIAKLKS